MLFRYSHPCNVAHIWIKPVSDALAPSSARGPLTLDAQSPAGGSIVIEIDFQKHDVRFFSNKLADLRKMRKSRG